MQTDILTRGLPSRVFTKETLVRGRPVRLESIDIDGQQYTVSPGPARVVSLDDEWCDDVKDPDQVVETLKDSGIKADIFTFWQRPPDLQPRYSFHIERDSIAVLPVKGYDYWFNKQISSRLRGQIRKATKEGLEVRETAYDDDFVRGMTEIFNETPIRQGRRFWHYGKDFETIKRQFSTNIHRESMIGAYFRGEMIGLVMLVNAGNYGMPGQIISKLSHRDKVTNNVLMGKAVEVCQKKGLPYIVYYYWTDDSLAEFKRRCGFERQEAPRYFVPLTPRGELALKLRFHRGWKNSLPSQIKQRLKKLRKFFYDMKGE